MDIDSVLNFLYRLLGDQVGYGLLVVGYVVNFKEGENTAN